VKVTGRREVSVPNESFRWIFERRNVAFPSRFSAFQPPRGSIGRIMVTIRRMKASLLGLVSTLLATAALTVPGCGSDEPKEKKQGSSMECDGKVCSDVPLGQGYPPIKACCAANGGCGLNGSPFEQYGAHFTDDCVPQNQPGESSDDCASSPPVATDFGELTFTGCCTAAGRCGYWMDSAFGLISLKLGCVDAAPFLDAGVPASCTPGAGGGGS
jgi:hypothetical protein